MKFIVINCLFAILFLNINKVQAQVDIFRDVVPSGSTKRVYEDAKNNKNEIESVFSGLFLIYKSFFSSQDMSSCTFSPSCSEYGLLCLKHYGLIRGGIMTTDRLSRCNGLSTKNYEFDKKTLLLVDNPILVNKLKVISEIK